jgi:hypothetical protein
MVGGPAHKNNKRAKHNPDNLEHIAWSSLTRTNKKNIKSRTNLQQHMMDKIND